MTVAKEQTRGNLNGLKVLLGVNFLTASGGKIQGQPSRANDGIWSTVNHSPSLSSSHSVLLLLSELGSRRLLGLLDLDDLVTHGVELVLLVLLLEVDSGTGSLTLGPVLTRGDELSILHGPDFSADLLDERVRRVSMCKEEKMEGKGLDVPTPRTLGYA